MCIIYRFCSITIGIIFNTLNTTLTLYVLIITFSTHTLTQACMHALANKIFIYLYIFSLIITNISPFNLYFLVEESFSQNKSCTNVSKGYHYANFFTKKLKRMTWKGYNFSKRVFLSNKWFLHKSYILFWYVFKVKIKKKKYKV